MVGEQNEASDALVRSRMQKLSSSDWRCSDCDFRPVGRGSAALNKGRQCNTAGQAGGEGDCLACILPGLTSNVKLVPGQLNAHVELHHVQVSFVCHLCLTECRTRNSLLLHRSRYHKPTYPKL